MTRTVQEDAPAAGPVSGGGPPPPERAPERGPERGPAGSAAPPAAWPFLWTLARGPVSGFSRLGTAADGRVAAALFAGTAFLSAVLLFSIQPMFAKMVLPLLGGSPSVWAVALCFFQGALLAGYALAHGAITFLPLRWTGAAHGGLCLLALFFLPVAVPAGWREPPEAPYLWQLGLFAAAIGVPFTAVAANAPLLQAWYAATGHPRARNPYGLYAASNAGSLLALLGYPFVLEPLFGLSALGTLWAAGFLLLLPCLAVCFLCAAGAAAGGRATGPVSGETHSSREVSAPADSPAPAPEAPGWREGLFWVWLAFVPSALLTAFTAHMSTDVASAPLLWVLPLALYLLTFVLAFRERLMLPPGVLAAAHLAAVTGVLLFLAQTKHTGWRESTLVGLAVFFLSALAVHRTLYEARPAARRLTGFYLLMALGGALGGLFSALLAPRLFLEVYEYPLLLALTMTCRSGLLRALRTPRGAALTAAAAAAGSVALWHAARGGSFGFGPGNWGEAAVPALLFATGCVLFWGRPAGQAVMALAMCGAVVLLPSAIRRGDALRSYFGVYRVFQSEDGEFNVLMHGTTLHGAQRIRDTDGNSVADATPATYYYPGSPMERSVAIVRNALETEGRRGRYGVVGLGTGTLACWSRADETWRFFEIDPVVVDIAWRSSNFTYLANCRPEPDIVLGDARLKLAREPDGSFDLLIVDAFTSDAIPVHLMTAEALRLYLAKLGEGGILILHISNRYLDLESVLGATLGLLPGVHGLLVSDNTAVGTYGETSSTIAVFARRLEALDPFRGLPGAAELDRGKLNAWTDEFSDILGPFLSRVRSQ